MNTETIPLQRIYQGMEELSRKYRCDSCGRKTCPSRGRAICWTHCGGWASDEEGKGDKPC